MLLLERGEIGDIYMQYNRAEQTTWYPFCMMCKFRIITEVDSLWTAMFHGIDMLNYMNNWTGTCIQYALIHFAPCFKQKCCTHFKVLLTTCLVVVIYIVKLTLLYFKNTTHCYQSTENITVSKVNLGESFYVTLPSIRGSLFLSKSVHDIYTTNMFLKNITPQSDYTRSDKKLLSYELYCFQCRTQT